jgi:hypothetical protein
VIKFRPKKSKQEQLAGLITIDEESDDEIDEGTFAANAPLSPSHLEDGRKLGKYTRDVLKLNVHHGDIVIQQGTGLQKYYEVPPV